MGLSQLMTLGTHKINACLMDVFLGENTNKLCHNVKNF